MAVLLNLLIFDLWFLLQTISCNNLSHAFLSLTTSFAYGSQDHQPNYRKNILNHEKIISSFLTIQKYIQMLLCLTVCKQSSASSTIVQWNHFHMHARELLTEMKLSCPIHGSVNLSSWTSAKYRKHWNCLVLSKNGISFGWFNTWYLQITTCDAKANCLSLLKPLEFFFGVWNFGLKCFILLNSC